MSTYKIRSHVEGVKFKYGQTVVTGWAFGARPGGGFGEEVQIAVFCDGQPVQQFEIERTERPDLLPVFFASGKDGASLCFGFRLCFPSSPEQEYRLVLLAPDEAGGRQEYRVQGSHVEEAGAEGLKKRIKQGIKGLLGRNRAGKASGFAGPEKNAVSPAPQPSVEILPDDPLISVIVPVYRPEPIHYMEMIESVLAQTYEKWELCLADGSESPGPGGEDYEKLTRQAAGADLRVHYKKLERNEGISGNTNQALAMAAGQWIAMLDHDDLLEPSALWEAVLALRQEPQAGFVYTDSDLTDYDAMKNYNPLEKPDWSPEMMYSANYITHFSLIRKDIMDAAGGFDRDTDGAQDWDMFFKASEKAGRIVHIPRVLYHWRVAKTSTALSVETKPYALDAQLRAINAHFRRMGYAGKAFFEDRNRYLIRVAWDRPVTWRLCRLEELTENLGTENTAWEEAISGDSAAPAAAADEAVPENGLTQPVPPQVFLVDCGTVDLSSVSEETCRELAQWAVHDGIGLVFPKLLDKTGNILSAGVMVTGAQAEDLYVGSPDHRADVKGNTDWYRNVQVQAPALFALSRQTIERYGLFRPQAPRDALAEYAARLSAGGLRHLMNPFARVVCKEGWEMDAGQITGSLYQKYRQQADAWDKEQ